MPFVRLEKTLALADGYRQHFTINGTPILLLVIEQRPIAFINRCPHQGGVFTRATVQGESIICPKHGIRFNLATGCAEQQHCNPLEMITLEYEGAYIGVRLK